MDFPRSMRRGTELADYADVVSYTDNSGRLWFAVEGGALGVMTQEGKFEILYRVSHDSRIRGSRFGIYAIYEDKHHVIWAGASNGLNRLVDGRIVPVTLTQRPRRQKE